MRKGLYRLSVGLLAFTLGVVGTFYYRDYQFQRHHLMWAESYLRHDLSSLRRAIDDYAAAKGELPHSLNDLVKAEYLQEIPYDYMTGRRAWKVVWGNDPNSPDGKQGIVDVHSTSPAISSDGTPYADW